MGTVTRMRMGLLAGIAAVMIGVAPVGAQVTSDMQAIAEAAAQDADIAAFYRTNGYQPIWTGDGALDKARRAALIRALTNAADHALPVGSYKVEALRAMLAKIDSRRELGRVEVEMSRVFLQYARDVQTGILTPAKIDEDIVREVPLRDRTELLQAFADAAPAAFLRSLPPQSPEYARLLKAKVLLENQQRSGGWGPEVSAGALAPGDTGPAVIELRNRLIAMNYLRRSVSQTYDATLQKAVQQFQIDTALDADGIAGPETMKQINKQIEDRLPAVFAAIERERWINMPKGQRYVWVNLADFRTRLVENDLVVFETKSVIGKDAFHRRSPEFSDQMEYMVINPNWYVPNTIARSEYLPKMLANPGAAGYLQLIDNKGRVVSRNAVNFSKYTVKTFPYSLRQPPSSSNALGYVKFMFPNKYNIYLHDTPAKNLFLQDKRDFSWGCIRLNDPFDFAYQLLSKQEEDPVAFFQERLKSGENTRVGLKTPVPVHLVYRTAYTSAKGRMNYRNDVYGRDAKIYEALIKAGVVPGAVRS